MDRCGKTPARYTVIFRSGRDLPAVGVLEVEEDRLRLEGRSHSGLVALEVPYRELVEVRIGRAPEDRLNGSPALVLERKGGEPIQVEPYGVGLLHELAQLLSALGTAHADRSEQVAVVVPLRRSRVLRARELVAEGPPFDPAALGFSAHQVFLTEDEAVFVFAGPHVRATLERMTRDPTLWRVGLAWRGCLAGRPRLVRADESVPVAGGEPAYSWTATEDP